MSGLSNYHFTHDGLLTPKVVRLREREGLEEIVRGAGSELEFFERQTLWARRQFEPGVPDPYPLSNGLDILDDIRSGRTGGFCGQYAYLLADALKSFGYFDVRYVELWAEEGRSHFLVEVWSNRRAHWVLLDPLHAALVVDENGEPMSTWEVHAVATGSSSRRAMRRWLAPPDEVPRDNDERYLQLFRLPAVSLTNDLSRRVAPWTLAERRQEFLALRDRTNRQLLPGYYAQESGREADFRGGRNLCRVRVVDTPGGREARLDSLGSCAYFSRFEVRFDGGAWSEADWKVRVPPRTRSVACRTVNRMQVRGVVTRLTLGS